MFIQTLASSVFQNVLRCVINRKLKKVYTAMLGKCFEGNIGETRYTILK